MAYARLLQERWRAFIIKCLLELLTIPGAFAMPDVQTAYSIILLLSQIWCLRP